MKYNSIILSKKEKENINELFSKVTMEMHEFFLQYKRERIILPIEMSEKFLGLTLSRTCMNLYIDDKDIYLIASKKNSDDEKIFLMKNGKVLFSSNSEDEGKNYDSDLMFLANYEKIREDLKKLVEEEVTMRKEREEKIRRLNNIFQQGDDVTVSFSPSNQEHQITVTEENECNVGIIDFGGQTVKILSKGNIILVNNKSDNKVKEQKNY